MPVAVVAPNSMAPASRSVTSTPATATAPVKLFPDSPSVTFWPVAATVVVPVTVNAEAAVWVTAPPAVTDRLPVAVVAPNSMAFVSRSATSAPVTATAPVKLFPDSPSVTFWAVAVIVVVPVTVSAVAAVWVTAPPAVTDRFVAAVAPNTMAFVSRSVTSAPVTATAPVKLFPLWFSDTVWPAALAVVVPPTLSVPPVWLMAPPAFIERLPPRSTLPNRVMLSVASRFSAPEPALVMELFTSTLPAAWMVRLFALVYEPGSWTRMIPVCPASGESTVVTTTEPLPKAE